MLMFLELEIIETDILTVKANIKIAQIVAVYSVKDSESTVKLMLRGGQYHVVKGTANQVNQARWFAMNKYDDLVDAGKVYPLLSFPDRAVGSE